MFLRPAYPVRTGRLALRPLTASDAADLLEYRSRPDVARYVPFEPMTADGIEARLGTIWARSTITGDNQAITLGVELEGRVIGDVMLAFNSAHHRAGEIGWILNPDYSGRGYATEAAHAVLHLAFDQLELHRVVARIDSRNAASLRLAARLGMRQEAYLVANEWLKGEWTDEVDFALLEHEWGDLHHEVVSCRGPG